MLPDSDMTISAVEPLLVPEQTVIAISDQEFEQIGKVLLFKRGFNLGAYKDNCIKRRIAIRIRSNHCETVQDYCSLLNTEKSEADQLLKVLTIHVSQFFRNLTAFEKLRTAIIPQLFAAARGNGRKNLRFWSLGCAGGEEPYSLALLLAEHFAREAREIPVIIDATDVDETSLRNAEKALYNHDRLLETPLNYIEKYFSEEGHQYLLSSSIREMVSFRQGEIFNDRIYEECDLLLCRNVLIYFARKQQEMILMNIARVLGKNGYLMLGKSEAILGNCRHHFQAFCPEERIYRPQDSFQY